MVSNDSQILYHAMHRNIGLQSLRALRPPERFNIPNVPAGEAALSAPRESLIQDEEVMTAMNEYPEFRAICKERRSSFL
jgi:hypothetical protein